MASRALFHSLSTLLGGYRQDQPAGRMENIWATGHDPLHFTRAASLMLPWRLSLWGPLPQLTPVPLPPGLAHCLLVEGALEASSSDGCCVCPLPWLSYMGYQALARYRDTHRWGGHVVPVRTELSGGCTHTNVNLYALTHMCTQRFTHINTHSS